MAKIFGLLVGLAYAGAAAAKTTSHFHEKGTDAVLRRDRVELTGAAGNGAVGDTISLGVFGSNAYIDPLAAVCHFDDLGTGITVDVGYSGDTDALVANQDVAAAAGNFSLFKGVDIANWFKPLWQVLGLAADPGGKIELLMTIKGAAATGTVVWSIKGQDR